MSTVSRFVQLGGVVPASGRRRRFVATAVDLKTIGMKAYDPAQPRAPKGSPEGGRWTAAVRAGGVFPPDDAIRSYTPAQRAAHAAAVIEADKNEFERHHLSAVSFYTGSGSKTINAALRAFDDDPEGDYNEDALNDGAAIAELMGQQAPSLVYRGFFNRAGRAFEVGEVIEFSGLQSASFDPRVAAKFADDFPGRVTMFEILTPIGFAPGHRSAAAVPEYELVLPHGSRWRVAGVKRLHYGLDKTEAFHTAQLVPADLGDLDRAADYLDAVARDYAAVGLKPGGGQ